MLRLEGFLTHQAQKLDPTATVTRVDGVYVLAFHGKPSLEIGTRWREARLALDGMIATVPAEASA